MKRAKLKLSDCIYYRLFVKKTGPSIRDRVVKLKNLALYQVAPNHAEPKSVNVENDTRLRKL